MLVYGVLVLYEATCVLVRYAENILPFMSRDDLVAVLWIEVLELLERCTCDLAYLLEVKLLFDYKCVHGGRHHH